MTFDDKILSAVGLKKADVARRLGVTPQAVSIGLTRAREAGHHFFHAERVSRLFSTLIEDRPEAASKLREAVGADSAYRDAFKTVNTQYVAQTPYGQLYTEFHNVDFFNLTPREFISEQARGYLKRATSATATIDIAYFLPGDDSDNAHAEYRRRFGGLIESSSLRINFLGSDAFRFLPPCVAATRKSNGERSLFTTSTSSPLAIEPIARISAQAILDHMQSLGIRYSDDEPFTKLAITKNLLSSYKPHVLKGIKYGAPLGPVEVKRTG